MKAKLTWKDGMNFTGVGDSSNQPVELDSSELVGGKNLGARPMELVAIGVAGCTSMDVVSILRKMKVDFTAYEIEVDVTSSKEHPKIFTDMHFVYTVTGHDLDRESVEKAVKLSETKYCQGIAMMAKFAKITSEVVIVEAD